MSDKNKISIQECCRYYSIEATFIESLNEYGLIELIPNEDSYHIDYEQLSLLEKYIHLYYDMDINMEGIEAINYLLQKIDTLQSELRQLRRISNF